MFRTKISFLAVVLIIALLGFSGCRPTSNDKSNKTSVDLLNGETVKLVWYHPGNKQPDHDMVQKAFNEKLKEKLNAEVAFQVIPYGDYNQRMNIMTAAREEFDICFTSDWLNNINTNISKGAFTPLDQLIDKYATELKEDLPQMIFDAAKSDGKIYAIPNYQVMYRQWAVVMPKDLVQKYKFDIASVPQNDGFNTISAIEPYLQNIKDNEPDLYPIQSNTDLSILFNEKISSSNIAIRKDSKDYKVFNVFEADEWKKSNDIFSRWYEKGFIRNDIISVMDERSDFQNQKYAAFFSVSKPGGLSELSNKYGREFVEIALEEPYLPFNAGMSSANAISFTSKSPEHAIKLLEIMNTDVEQYNLMCFGIENTHYNKISDTQIEPVKDSKYQPGTSWMFGNQFNAFLMPGQEPDVWEKTHEINISAKKSPIHGFVFNPDPIREKLSQITSLVSEYKLLYVDNGKRMPELMAKLKQAGIDEVKAEIELQIKAWRE